MQGLYDTGPPLVHLGHSAGALARLHAQGGLDADQRSWVAAILARNVAVLCEALAEAQDVGRDPTHVPSIGEPRLHCMPPLVPTLRPWHHHWNTPIP